MKVLITQSNYIPWIGYFEAIRQADLFVSYDEVQYTRRDWRNRNRIKTAQGLQWLSIPVQVKGRFQQKIREVEVADGNWADRHWQSLRHAYRQAPCFEAVEPLVKSWYKRAESFRFLTDINHFFLREICQYLGIATPFQSSENFTKQGDATQRLLHICQQVGATTYLSGPSAQAYLQSESFAEAGIAVQWLTYENLPVYPQLHGPFEQRVSVLDMMFNLEI
jgi:hypothetical protein